jgi:hypothetical protein
MRDVSHVSVTTEDDHMPISRIHTHTNYNVIPNFDSVVSIVFIISAIVHQCSTVCKKFCLKFSRNLD